MSMLFSWINLRLVCYLSILYFRKVIIAGDIFIMFKIFRIHLMGTLSKVFCSQSKQYLDFPVWFDNIPGLFFLWRANCCSHIHLILFCIPFVLKGRCPYILWIWLFSPLELMLSYYMLWESMWLVSSFFFAFVVFFVFVSRFVTN